jgi:hypothetical protein
MPSVTTPGVPVAALLGQLALLGLAVDRDKGGEHARGRARGRAQRHQHGVGGAEHDLDAQDLARHQPQLGVVEGDAHPARAGGGGNRGPGRDHPPLGGIGPAGIELELDVEPVARLQRARIHLVADLADAAARFLDVDVDRVQPCQRGQRIGLVLGHQRPHRDRRHRGETRDRAADLGAVEIELRHLERHFRRALVGLRLLQRDLRRGQVLLRDTGAEQALVTGHGLLRGGDRGLGQRHLGAVGLILDAEEHVARLDRAAELVDDLRDPPADPRPHVHLLMGHRPPRHGHREGHVPRLERHHPHLGSASARLLGNGRGGGKQKQRGGDGHGDLP